MSVKITEVTVKRGRRWVYGPLDPARQPEWDLPLMPVDAHGALMDIDRLVDFMWSAYERPQVTMTGRYTT